MTRKTAFLQAEIAAIVTDGEIDADDDAAALILMALRKRGSGINLRSTPPTTGRCTRILKILGLTVGGHGRWCGFTLKEWIKVNPQFNEREWSRLVAENYDSIKEENTMQGTGN